jgi:hypothetical protein
MESFGVCKNYQKVSGSLNFRPKLNTSPERDQSKELDDEINERNIVFDRLPMYKKNVKFEEERIKMFFN